MRHAISWWLWILCALAACTETPSASAPRDEATARLVTVLSAGSASWHPITVGGSGAFGPLAVRPGFPLEMLGGSDVGSLLYTSDGGANWSVVQGIASQEIHDIFWTPDGEAAYVATDMGLYRSVLRTNKSPPSFRQWIDLSAGIPPNVGREGNNPCQLERHVDCLLRSVQAVAVDRGGRIYIAMGRLPTNASPTTSRDHFIADPRNPDVHVDVKIFRSDDGGATFQPLLIGGLDRDNWYGDDKPPQVFDLAIARDGTTLFVCDRCRPPQRYDAVQGGAGQPAEAEAGCHLLPGLAVVHAGPTGPAMVLGVH